MVLIGGSTQCRRLKYEGHHASNKKKDPYEENLLEHVEFENQLYFKSMNTSTRFPTVAETPISDDFCFMAVSAAVFLIFSGLLAWCLG